MTDNPFSSALDEAPAPVAVEETAEGRDKKVLALGALAAVAVAAGGFLLLGGGGEAEDEFFVPSAAGRAPAPVVTPEAVVELPQATNVRLGDSPFDVKYIQPAPAPVDPDPAPAPATPVDLGSGTGGSVVVVPIGGGGQAPAPGTDAPPAAPEAKEYKLILVRVFGEGGDQSASFSIDGKEQVAKVGSTFGPTAEILLLGLTEGPEQGQWTASIQVGDDAPLDVALGEPVFVR